MVKTEFCHLGFCITLKEWEIKAEAGLCVVIPCSFSVPSFFGPEKMTWLKCDYSQEKCSDSDIISHHLLLEPNINRRNCSIIINDLSESDSGFYQLRLNGYNYNRWNQDRFLFPYRSRVSVTGKKSYSMYTV